jgi:MOSC domain-containing protein YiiM
MRPVTLLTGRAAPLPGSDTLSGIDKTPVSRPLTLGPEGFAGDEQADRRVHGGIEKAVHHYPLDHYSDWRAELGDLPALTAPGGFGENISTDGLTEAEVAVGDTFQLGDALIQVSQGRQPCWPTWRGACSRQGARDGITGCSRPAPLPLGTGWS